MTERPDGAASSESKEQARRGEPDGSAQAEVSEGLGYIARMVPTSTVSGAKTRPATTGRDLIRWLVEVAEEQTRPLPLRLAIHLAAHASRGGADRKQADIAAEVGIKTRNLQYALKQLGEHLEVRRNHGQGVPSTYVLLLRGSR
jgi:hypothetical protein